MRYITGKTTSILLFASLITACTSNEAQNSGSSSAQASVGSMIDQTTPAVEVLRQYHQALVLGDSAKAVSLSTGTARAILEYRFFRSEMDSDLKFAYGGQNIIRDTCYIPIDVISRTSGRTQKEGKAIMVKVEGEWKVERIAMQK